MTYDVGYLFICLLTICVFPLVRCLFRNCPIYFTGLFVFSSLNIKIFFVYFDYNSFIRYMLFRYFLLVCGFLFILLTVSLVEQILILIKFNIPSFSSWIMLTRKIITKMQDHLDFPIFSSKDFIVLHFTFMSMIHFEFL